MEGNLEKEYSKFFEKAFDALKIKAKEYLSFEEDGSASPEVLTLWTVIKSLPFPLDIIELKIDIKIDRVKDDVIQIIRYDFSKFERKIKYHGIINLSEIEKYKELFKKVFDLNLNEPSIKSFKDLSIIGWGEPSERNYWIEVTQFNILKDFDEFVMHLLFMFVLDFRWYFINRFMKKEINYSEKYNLKPDEILSLKEFMKGDKIYSKIFTDVMIEKLQRDVSNVLLIPKVPESTQRVFEISKKLYVLSYFHYGLAVTADHYACLSLESALKNRYIQSFGNEINLMDEKGLIHKVGPSYEGIHYLMKQKKWNFRKLKINNEKFLWSLKDILEWMVNKKILTEYERRICEPLIETRHSLSHPTFYPIHPPNMRTLLIVAELINKMFDKM